MTDVEGSGTTMSTFSPFVEFPFHTLISAQNPLHREALFLLSPPRCSQEPPQLRL